MKPKRFPMVTTLLILAPLLVGGCWVKEEVGKRMQADIIALQVELDVVKEAHAKEKAQLQQRIQEADKQIVELVKIIDEYKRATGRNAADFGVDIERIKTQLMEMKGQLEVSEHRLGKLEQNLSAVHKDVTDKMTEAEKGAGKEDGKEDGKVNQEMDKKNEAPPDPLAAIKRPEKKKNFYKLAHGLLEAGQVVAARTLFKEFLDKWPTDSYSDNAMYWIAESYYAENDFRLAALTFQKVRTQFPKGDKSKDALLKLGYCFYAMEKYKEALPFLREFVQAYPKSALAKKAKKKIKEANKRLKKSR